MADCKLKIATKAFGKKLYKTRDLATLPTLWDGPIVMAQLIVAAGIRMRDDAEPLFRAEGG